MWCHHLILFELAHLHQIPSQKHIYYWDDSLSTCPNHLDNTTCSGAYQEDDFRLRPPRKGLTYRSQPAGHCSSSMMMIISALRMNEVRGTTNKTRKKKS